MYLRQDTMLDLMPTLHAVSLMPYHLDALLGYLNSTPE